MSKKFILAASIIALCILNAVSVQFAYPSEIGGLHYVYWDFPLNKFTSLYIDIGILSEPDNNDGLYFQMYQGTINGEGFYFGLQTQTYKPGYGSMGKGLIFSRWGTRDLSNVRIVEGGWAESGGHEGDFVGIRRTYSWTTHYYRLKIALNDTDSVGDWYGVWISDLHEGTTDLLGSVRFPKVSSNESGIADGGITWTELYWKAQPGTPIPAWHVSIINIYASEQQVFPLKAVSAYSEIDHTDIYCDETKTIHFLMGLDVSRTHLPGVLFECTRARILFDETHNEYQPLRISTGFKDLVKEMEERGYSLSHLEIGPVTLSELLNYDVFAVIDPFPPLKSFSSQEIEAIKEFVSRGGGLLLTSVGWSWIEYGGVDIHLDPANVLGKEFGIVVNDDYVCDPTNNRGDIASPIFHEFATHQIVNGVSEIAATAEGKPDNPGFPSSLNVSFPARAVVWGDEDSYSGGRNHVYPSGSNPPVVAAREFENGRVIFMGHEGFMADIYRYDNLKFVLNVFDWLATGVGDLSILNVKPFQVVLDAKALVANKSSAILVNVSSTFSTRVWAEINITYNFGKDWYLETGPYGNGTPIEPGLNRIYVPGGPVFSELGVPVQEDWSTNPEWLEWTAIGYDTSIAVKLDPLNKISETNEDNNSKVTEMKVIQSKPLKILIVPVYFPDIGQRPITPSKTELEGQREYLRGTYPIGDDKFLWSDNSSPIPIYGIPGVVTLPPPLPPLSIPLDKWLYLYVARDLSAMTRTLGYDRVVIVIQHLDQWWAGYAIGMWIQDRVPVIVVNENLWYDSLVAHEIGHTYYILHPNQPWPFAGPQVFNAEKFWVAERDYESDATTFMNATLPWVSWIDKGRFDSDPLVPMVPGVWWRWNLFDQLTTGADPEVIILRFIIFENDTAVADKPWYRSMGTPDLVPGATGNYSIVLLDGEGQLISQMGINASFTYFREVNGTMVEAQTDALPFIFNIPYINGISVIQIRNATNHVLLSKSISAHPPTVNVVFPNGGEVLTVGANYTISWEAFDSDGDKLTYLVAYSQNGGEPWIPLALDLNQTHYTWDTSDLPLGNKYVVKVIATDGVNTGESISEDNFQVIPEFPSVSILALIMILTMLVVVLAKRRFLGKLNT